MNVIGIKEAARLNIVLAVADLATQVLIMIIGVVLLLAPRLLIEQVDLWTAPTMRQFVYAISIGTIAYTGIETISNMAEEAANPDRDVPKAINMVLGHGHRRVHRHVARRALRYARGQQRAARGSAHGLRHASRRQTGQDRRHLRARRRPLRRPPTFRSRPLTGAR